MTVVNSYDKQASEIKKGDYLFGKKVTLVNPKRTNTYITLDEPVDGKNQWIFRHTDLLEVGVEELTDEEKAEKEAETKRFYVEQVVEKVREFADKGAEKLAEAHATAQKRAEEGWGPLDYQSLDRLLEAMASAKVAGHVSHFFSKSLHVHEGEHVYGEDRKCTIKGDKLTDYDRVVMAVKALTKLLLDGAVNRRLLSRSTSLTSNLCEDLEQVAVADFLKSLRYDSWHLPELRAILPDSI